MNWKITQLAVVDELIDFAASEYGYSDEEILERLSPGKRKPGKLLHIKRIIAEISSRHLALTYEDIGKALGGMERAGVWNLIEAHKRKMGVDNEYTHMFHVILSEYQRMMKEKQFTNSKTTEEELRKKIYQYIYPVKRMLK